VGDAEHRPDGLELAGVPEREARLERADVERQCHGRGQAAAD
jgi:hypothetical protein